MSKTCAKQCYGFATLYRGRGGILNTLFKIPIIFVTDHLKFTKKKKEERGGLMYAVANDSNLFL